MATGIWVTPTQISIHALRMEGDRVPDGEGGYTLDFNPRPPHGGRPRLQRNNDATIDISIHALRMEGDCVAISLTALLHRFQSTPSAWRATKSCAQLTLATCDFNPRPPHGGRHFRQFEKRDAEIFQSTPSAWRATEASDRRGAGCQISIHALRMEGDGQMIVCLVLVWDYFNPRPPHGGRHLHDFSISHDYMHFNPRPPHGGRPQKRTGKLLA